MGNLENEIRTSLMNEGKGEMITGGFRIYIKGHGEVEITELPPINLEQLELPLTKKTRTERRRP